MAENTNNDKVAATTVETSDRGLFDFMKNDDDVQKTSDAHVEEKFASEFDEKVQVSEPPEYKDVEEIKHDSLLDKFHQADDGSSSSSSDEEGDDEEKKKRKKEKKEKKGLKEKLIEKLPGHKDEEDTNVSIEKPQVQEVVYSEPSYPEEDVEKKGFLDKIKEKLPGQKKADDHHDKVAPVVAETSVEVEGEEKKGLMERIKDKIPGLGCKTDEEKKDHE